MLFNTRTYSFDRANSPDSTTYTGSAHSFVAKDTLTMSRTYPKRSGSDLGVSKPYFKYTKSVIVDAVTGEKKDLIFYVGASVPVGTPTADIDNVLADLAAWINTADSKSLYKTMDINV